MKIISHRGRTRLAHWNPDNYLGAFAAAIIDGFDGVELDLRSSKDGIVLCHDEEAQDRIDDQIKLVKNIQSEYIRVHWNRGQTSLKPWHKPNTLDELLTFMETVKDKVFNLEIKDKTTLQTVSDKLKEHPEIVKFNQIYISSFWHDVILFGPKIENVKYGILMCAGMNYGAFVSMIDHCRDNFDFIVLENEFTDSKEIKYIKKQKMEAWTYGVPKSKSYLELLTEGWDAVITDHYSHISARKEKLHQ